MSEPWTWDDVPEYQVIVGEETTGETDPETDLEDRKLIYRIHIVARRSKLMTAAEVSAETATQASTAEASLSATLGDTVITRTFTTGKWVCTSDHIRALEKPAAFARREQTWEFYSQWEEIPDDWDWEQDPVQGGGE
jgi:hypothetical protein